MKNSTKILAGTAALGAAAAAGVNYFFELAVQKETKAALPGEEKEKKELSEKELARKEIREKAEAWVETLPGVEDIYITSYDGLRLHAKLIPAEKETVDCIILVHGYRANGFVDFSGMLEFYRNKLGLNILMVDNRAHGESEGDYVGFGWQDHFDVEKWMYHLAVRYGEHARIFAHGMSMGAATVMLTSGDALPAQVKGLIEDCGYTTLKAELDHCMERYYHVPDLIYYPVGEMAKYKAGYNFDDCDCLKALKRAEIPMLFIHGDTDDFVPTPMVYDCYETCTSEDKSLTVIEGAGHAESHYIDPETYEKALADFITAH